MDAPTLTPTVTDIPRDSDPPTITPSPTPTSDDVEATAKRNSSCRVGANAVFPVHNFLYEEQSAKLIGRLADNSWFYLELPDDLGRCWIYAENLEIFGPIVSLPLFTSPEFPAPSTGGGSGGGGDGGGGGSGDGDSSGDGGGGGGGGGDSGGDDPPDDPDGPEDCAPDEYWSIATQSCQPFG